MTTANERRRRLRALMAAPGIAVAPSAYDALSAMLVQDGGFPAIHVSGSGVARSFGVADVGLVTAPEMVEVHERIVEATDIPTVGDAETGFGNAANVIRSVRAYERAGVSAIHLEDDFTPKRPGGDPSMAHGAIPVAEMVGKLRAALDARTDPDFILIARSNARDAESLATLVDRLHAYEETGVDALWPGVSNLEELEQLRGRFRLPLVGVPPRPRVSPQQYADYGYKIACLPGILGQAASAGMRAVLNCLKTTGDTQDYFATVPDLATTRAWYSAIGRALVDRVERDYSGTPTPHA
jgi:2-methylisocitrate lyase-like PEP mutase family enzyme